MPIIIPHHASFRLHAFDDADEANFDDGHGLREHSGAAGALRRLRRMPISLDDMPNRTTAARYFIANKAFLLAFSSGARLRCQDFIDGETWLGLIQRDVRKYAPLSAKAMPCIATPISAAIADFISDIYYYADTNSHAIDATDELL